MRTRTGTYLPRLTSVRPLSVQTLTWVRGEVGLPIGQGLIGELHEIDVHSTTIVEADVDVEDSLLIEVKVHGPPLPEVEDEGHPPGGPLLISYYVTQWVVHG